MSLFGKSGNQPTTLTKDFSRSPKAEIQRSVFNRDHGLKTTIDAGKLYPIFYETIQYKKEVKGMTILPVPYHGHKKVMQYHYR